MGKDPNLNDVLRVERRPRRSTDQHLTFDVRSDYVERLWLPVLGPTATWLWMFTWDATTAGPVELDVNRLADSLGVSTGARRGTLSRALTRLARYHVARYESPRLILDPAAGPVPPRILGCLAPHIQALHATVLATTPRIYGPTTADAP